MTPVRPLAQNLCSRLIAFPERQTGRRKTKTLPRAQVKSSGVSTVPAETGEQKAAAKMPTTAALVTHVAAWVDGRDRRPRISSYSGLRGIIDGGGRQAARAD
jgi:hypothetical protein